VISQRVEFAANAAVLLPASEGVLEQIRALLAATPSLRKVRIEGHTDNVGQANTNRRLSYLRANVVKGWLVQHGIDPARLQAVGRGSAHPVADNGTPAGRQANRRVEFIID
jgi:outer membrane protein OmpA-like peptidoglycan-associated protein